MDSWSIRYRPDLRNAEWQKLIRWEKQDYTDMKCENTNLLKVGKMQSDAGVTVDDEQVEVVEHFKYLGSLKSADGNC